MAETEPAAAYRVRTCSAGDQPAVIDLLRLTVGETEASRKTPEYWEWKHLNSPFGPSYVVAAFSETDNQMCGLRALMRWQFHDTRGIVHHAVRPVDTATHPRYQRRGIFSALTRHAVEELRSAGVAFVFNTPNHNSLPGYLKMGWQIVERWPLYVRPTRPVRAAWKALVGTAASRERTAADDALLPWPAFQAKWQGALDELVTASELRRIQVGYRTPRNAAYIEWRYGAQPNVPYGVHVMEDDKGLAGIGIGRVADGWRGTRALILTEIFLRSPSVRTASRLIHSALRRTSCDYVAGHAAHGTIERRAFRRMLFFPMRNRGYTFVAKGLNTASLDPSDRKSWDLTLGELEIF